MPSKASQMLWKAQTLCMNLSTFYVILKEVTFYVLYVDIIRIQ